MKLITKYFSNLYAGDLRRFYKYNISNKDSVLEINHNNFILLKKNEYKKLTRINYDNVDFKIKTKYDYIIIPDTLSTVIDIQKLFKNLEKLCTPKTRLIINYHNFLWLPILNIAEKLHLKKPQFRNNWLNTDDLTNLLEIENFQVIKSGKRFLLPIKIPILSHFINKYLANLPLINNICLTNFLIARSVNQVIDNPPSVSVIVAARNEKGNIENLIKRIPFMGKRTEIIFIEGGSTDGTYNEIKRIASKYKQIDIKYEKQNGKGKGDAVRKGFSIATGDILMILDADLTVPPEDLPKFYYAIATGKGEYINGCRLVYPMENEAMQFLNILGNKFFSITFSWLLNQKIKDTLCGTKVISRKNYLQLAKNRNYFGDFDPFGDYDLIFGAAKMNLKFIEIPIRYKARQYGSTNISRFKHGWLLIKMVVFALNKIKFVN